MPKFYTLLLLLCTIHVHAQTVSGTVVDATGQGLIGAQILNLDGGDHSHTNEAGQFLLTETGANDRLEISYLGYETVVVPAPASGESMRIQLAVRTVDLRSVVVSPELSSLNVLTDLDLQTRPVNSAQDVLRQVPGLIIGQHAGGGKAEQIFLRGFDIDHGTDLAIRADGMPVNMVSHAHGQGYADLHFLIPETIRDIDYGKGPYDARYGNFATAGHVDFRTRDALETSLLRAEVGQFNSQRLLGGFNLLNTDRHRAYLAAEHLTSDGPFDAPQDFRRTNFFGKFTTRLNETDRLRVLLSNFTSSWDASGQIPQRAVDSGRIGRFGAIDATEGGSTGRTNAAVQYDEFLDVRTMLSNRVYYGRYNFELFSNFTFFLEDPENGDQIRQSETRDLIGLESELRRSFSGGEWRAGVQLRNDRSYDNELSRTLNRTEVLEPIQRGDIDETNLAGYADVRFEFGKFTLNPALRFDRFDFRYQDALTPLYDPQSVTQSFVAPKLNLFYQHRRDVQLYAKFGRGFHANDTRVVVAQNGREVLPAAYGFDVGTLWKPAPRLLINAAYWHLFLEQEFVWVGDAGVVEPSGRTRRRGVDLSVRYQPLDWLFLNADVNYAHARAVDEPEGADRIPLAPPLTAAGSVRAKHPSGWFGSISARHLTDRPANEDNSIVAEGYTVTDLNIGREWNRLTLAVEVQNLFDVDWNETQFATESRLRNEAASVEEIHFTPGTPFFARGVVTWRF